MAKNVNNDVSMNPPIKKFPGVWLIFTMFTVNARSLNPKLEQIFHFKFFVLQVKILLIL